MVAISLKKHDIKYTEVISRLTSDIRLQSALNLNWQQVSIYGTRDLIEHIRGEERMGNQISRVIFNESNELIGIISLKEIDFKNKKAHMGTWIGADYWGMGYNELAKIQILQIAFHELDLQIVFAGAAITNKRSLAAQRKLPYMKLDVGEKFPQELAKIEVETGSKCVLNMVLKEDFEQYLIDNEVDLKSVETEKV